MPARLFVALTPPAATRDEIARLAEAEDDVRRTPPENLHLTLRFVGETGPEKQAAFAEALARVRVEPFILPVAGCGVFPTRGPAKAIWVGTGNGHPRLFQLRKQVDEALLRVDPGLAMPSFHPHLTIGRLREPHEPKALARFLAAHRAFEAPPFRLREFQLLASELRAGQPPVYRLCQSFPLGTD